MEKTDYQYVNIQTHFITKNKNIVYFLKLLKKMLVFLYITFSFVCEKYYFIYFFLLYCKEI